MTLWAGLAGDAASLLLAVMAAALLVPAVVLFLECALARAPRKAVPLPAGPRPRLAILVPAHDEAMVLEATLRSLLPQLAPGDRLLVVADNCRDGTAAVARAAGATVVERNEPALRGKGYALAFGVAALAVDPPEVVVIIDADCRLEPGGLDHLAHAAVVRNCPVQARNTVVLGAGAGPLAALSSFAFLLKNVVRTTGGARLGVPCPLMGTGMAFPWPLLAAAPLHTGSLTEDLQLGVDLTLAGYAPVFCAEACVTSPMPVRQEALVAQRRRWEYGYLATLGSGLPRLLWAGVTRHSERLLVVALDLSVPPLSLLVMLCSGLFAVALLAAGWLGASWVPALLLGVASLLVLAGVLLGWRRFGRDALPATTLAVAPLYALKKLPMYCGFLRHRRRAWVRTERDPPRPPGGPHTGQ